MIELTEEQRQGLGCSEPILIDPQTRKAYVLVPHEMYERFKELLSPDVSIR